MRLVLFDVDGTMVLSGGAGHRALKKAIQETFGQADSMDSIRPDGKTDPAIIKEALSRLGKEDCYTEETAKSLFSLYVPFLRDELEQSKNFQVLPGTRELVSSLNRNPEILLGLATGNIEKGARLKLEKAGLNSFFSFGGFGDDAENRTELICAAIGRGRNASSTNQLDATIVIGDTPRDIVHGKEAGAKTIATASGSYSLEALEAYKPDLAIASLEPIKPILEFIETTTH